MPSGSVLSNWPRKRRWAVRLQRTRLPRPSFLATDCSTSFRAVSQASRACPKYLLGTHTLSRSTLCCPRASNFHGVFPFRFLAVELGRNPQTTQYPNSFLGCNPHYAYKIISAPRAHDNIAELYVAPVTRSKTTEDLATSFGGVVLLVVICINQSNDFKMSTRIPLPWSTQRAQPFPDKPGRIDQSPPAVAAPRCN